MIATKNLYGLNDLLTQAETMRAVALHYTDMLKDKEAAALMTEIAKTSEKAHADLMTYLEGHK